MSESSDKGSVEVAETQKRADVLNFGWPRPVSYPLYFYWVHACHPLFNDYPQIIHLWRMEDTLFWFEEQVVPHCKLQYFHYAFDVVVKVGAGGDCHIIHVFANICSQWFPFVYYWPKNPTHHRLKHGWRVTETKEHHRWFPQPIFHLECRLVFVAFLDPYVVVSPSDVQLMI